mgnify:CR=1 FL=1
MKVGNTGFLPPDNSSIRPQERNRPDNPESVERVQKVNRTQAVNREGAEPRPTSSDIVRPNQDPKVNLEPEKELSVIKGQPVTRTDTNSRSDAAIGRYLETQNAEPDLKNQFVGLDLYV